MYTYASTSLKNILRLTVTSLYRLQWYTRRKVLQFKNVNSIDVSVLRNPVSPAYIVSPVRFAWLGKVRTITFSSSACGEHNSSYHLPSSCIYPCENLFLSGLGRRHCSRYINLDDRSSLKNKFSSLSSVE